jgi:CHAT domain-containing protein
MGEDAKAGKVKAEMPRYQILHFGTHCFPNANDGLSSWLLMATEQDQPRGYGRVEAREIASMPLSARLAVLAACDSGSGQISEGEGILGLTWAFHAAGCPNVVASYWRVEDRESARTMSEFYPKLKRGMPVEEALRAVMLEARRRNSTPQVWAAFSVYSHVATPETEVLP